MDIKDEFAKNIIQDYHNTWLDAYIKNKPDSYVELMKFIEKFINVIYNGSYDNFVEDYNITYNTCKNIMYLPLNKLENIILYTLDILFSNKIRLICSQENIDANKYLSVSVLGSFILDSYTEDHYYKGDITVYKVAFKFINLYNSEIMNIINKDILTITEDELRELIKWKKADNFVKTIVQNLLDNLNVTIKN